jgi:long-subunit fatty acid transport protein
MSLVTAPLLLALAQTAWATVPDTYGQGSANLGLGSAATALANDPHAAYYNPAGLAQLKRPTLTMGGIVGDDRLQGFNNIVYDTDADGQLQDADGYPNSGPVGADYSVRGPDDVSLYTAGSQIGLAFPIFDQWLTSGGYRWLSNRRLTFGLSVYLPTATTMRLQMEDPQTPYYVMFRNRNNRFALYPALGLKLMQGVYVGAGTQLKFQPTARIRISSYTTVDSFPNDQGDEEIEVIITSEVDELVLDLKPAMSPNFGVLFKPAEFMTAFTGFNIPEGEAWWNVLEHTSIGYSYRGDWGTKTTANVTVLANGEVSFDGETLLLSSLLAEPIEIELKDLVSLYNPPQSTFGVATGFDFGADDRNELLVTLDFNKVYWSMFTETTTPYQEMSVEALTGSSVTIKVGSDVGAPGFNDTVNVRMGTSFARDWTGKKGPGNVFTTTFRGGYGFVPTPVPDQTGITNYMDSDRHVVSAGVGLRFFPKSAPGPINIDLGGQYQQLVTRTVQKSADLVSDTDGDGDPDYPRGYPLAGEITSAGSLWVATLGATFEFGHAKRAPERTEVDGLHGLVPAKDEPESAPPPGPDVVPSAPPTPETTPAPAPAPQAL